MTDKKLNSRRLRAGKVALVTGASQGIGLAIALALATEGYAVVITGRNLPSLTRAAKKIQKRGTVVLPWVCDVREPQAVEQLFTKIQERFQRLDVLVNNAGIAHAN